MNTFEDQPAAQRFLGGFNCSQSVFLEFAESMGLSKEMANRLATGFGGGMGYSDAVCGAVSGGILAISLKHGAAVEGDQGAKAETYALVNEFLTRFRQEFGSLQCTHLQGHDLSQDGVLEAARATGVFKTRCPQIVQAAVNLVKDTLPE